MSLKERKSEPDVNRTRNLLIWSQTRYHCATDPLRDKIAILINIQIFDLLS